MVLGATFAAAASMAWSLLAGGLLGVVLLWAAGWLLDRLWWQPRRLERALRAQGLRGTSYRFPSGDLAEEERLHAAERTKPMPLLSHAISGRVEPLLDSTVKEHGT